MNEAPGSTDRPPDAKPRAELAETILYPSSAHGTADASVDRAAPAAPRTRYRVLGRLASGGLGILDRAWDGELSREVALKRLRDDRALRDGDRARFLREGSITAALEHPGIVPVHGRGLMAEGEPFFAMRLVRGRTLRVAIDSLHDQSRPADSRRSATLRALVGRLVQACQAVEYAHSRGVIHRDLKPENILLGPFGETLVVDWGLAKVVGIPEEIDVAEEDAHAGVVIGDQEETLPGSIHGTIAYMSPEQARGDAAAIGPGSDVYGLGATLHCLLTGQAPLRVDGRPAEALDRVVRGAIPPPVEVRPGVDADLDRICRRAMSLDAAARYASAGALADALDEWLADERAAGVRKLFTAALGAYGTLVFTVQDRLRHIPAAHAIREDLLNRAIRGLEELVEHAGGAHAVDLERSLGAAHEQIGDLAQQLGRTDDARHHYEAGLHSDDPTPGDDPRDLGSRSVRLGKLGDILRRQGDLSGAHEQYRLSLDSARALAALDGRSPRIRRGLEIILGKLSSLTRQLGDLDAARRYQEESLDISRRLLDDDPNSPRAQRGLAISLGRLGDLDRQAGDLDAARFRHQLSLELTESVLTRQPKDVQARRGLAISCNKLAEICRQIGDLDAARRFARKGIESAEALAQEDPWNVQTRRDLAIACNRLGEIDRQAGDLDAARIWSDRGLGLMLAMAAADPRDAHARRGLCLARLHLGELLVDQGDRHGAIVHLKEALALAEALVAFEPGDVQAQLDLARLCRIFGRLEGDGDVRHRWLSRGQALLRELQSSGRLSPAHERLLQELNRDLADQP